MCGRYALFGSISMHELAAITGVEEIDEHGPGMPTAPLELGNIAPGQDALVLVWSNGGTTFRVLRPSEE